MTTVKTSRKLSPAMNFSVGANVAKPGPDQDGFWEGVSLGVTNLIKVGGLVAAMNELLQDGPLDTKRVALIGVMLAGTQGIENFLKGVFGSK